MVKRKQDPRLSYGPSKRHVWKVKSQTVDVCERCGASFLHRLGGTAPWYCYPTPEWLQGHPGDDKKTH